MTPNFFIARTSQRPSQDMQIEQLTRRIAPRVATLAVFLLAGCGGGGSDRPLANFCGETANLEPILELTSVTNAETHASVPEVLLTNFSVDGTPTIAPAIFPARNTAPAEGGFRCTVPCEFGLASGRYEFFVSAAGYVTNAASVRAEYKNRVEGCVTELSGSTEVAFELVPL